MGKLKAHILLLLLLTGWGAMAQTEFTAKVNRNPVGRNQSFTLTFSLNANGSDFQPPDLSEFRILSGPNRSQQMQIVNYKRSVLNSFSYMLQAPEEGNFSIGAASIRSNGNTYRTEPIELQVTAGNPQADNPDDPYSQASDRAFIKVVTSKNRVYKGEPFVGSYKLYFKGRVGSPQLLEEPDFTNFYRENLQLDRIDTRNESYRGDNYTTGIIRQMVLIPQRTGSLEMGEVEMEIPTQIPTNRRDFFGRPLMRTLNQVSTAEWPEVEVLPLPDRGKPAGFGGAVGNFKMEVSLSRNELRADESVTLKVFLEGRGNIKLVDAPEPEIPAAFEVFDPKYSEDIRVSSSGMMGSKTYEYLLVPRYGGEYKIPSLNFSYFNPATRSYQIIRSEPMLIKVSGGSRPPAGLNGDEATPSENVDFIGKDILFIKTDAGALEAEGGKFLNSGTYFAILLLIALAFAGMLAYFLFSRRSRDFRQERSAKAGKVARKRLAAAKKELEAGNRDSFYQALAVALWGYFSDKLGIPQSDLSKEEIKLQLQSHGMETALTERVENMMNRAEIARYTGIGGNDPQQDYDETVDILTQIEAKL